MKMMHVLLHAAVIVEQLDQSLTASDFAELHLDLLVVVAFALVDLLVSMLFHVCVEE